MKKNTHPQYQDVLFIDSSTGDSFVCGSTLKTKEKAKFEGKEYPACHVSISSTSHPFFTGKGQFIDTEGRVDKFTKKYQMKKEQEQRAVAKKEEEAKAKTTAKRKKA